jgi:hypothetical protein
MKDQHTKIKGYRDLTQEEINLMNEAKVLAEQVGTLVDKIESTDGIDKRWAAIGKTDLQKGFMSLIRSVAQPTTF